MTFLDALAVLGRRWYLVVIGLAITAVLAVSAAYRLDGQQLVSRFAPQYETSAVVKVAANDPAAPAAGDAARVAYSLQTIVESGSFGRQIAEEVAGWSGGSIRASVPSQTSILELLVTGPTPLAAEEAMQQIVADLPDTAGSLVAPAPNPFTVEATGEPTPPAERPSTKGPLALVLAVVLGLAATWSVALAADRARSGRRSRRQRAEIHDVRERAEPDVEIERSRRVPEMAGEGAR